MIIAELPFWELLIYYLLPITIGVLLFIRILNLVLEALARFKEKAMLVLQDLADLMLYLMFMTGIIGIIYYLIGQQPDGFSIFDFLIEEMIPNTWYILLLYGILVNLQILLGRHTSG